MKAAKSPFKVKTSVFMPGTQDTSFKLAKGERLFVLTDKGLDECPNVGPDEVLVVSEQFGCWPVVAFKVDARAAEAWRETTAADHSRMMKRVRRALSPTPVERNDDA